MNKNCLIYNYAQHYREGIFKLLDSELEVDSYFGDKMGDVKKMNYEKLLNFKKELKNIYLSGNIYYQKGAVRLLFKNYDNYILLGEYYCLSTWGLLLLSKFTRKKIYLWTHGWYGNEGFLKKVVKKIFFKLSNGIFLYGDYAKNLMIKEGFNPNKIYVIFNSLNYMQQIKVRNKLKPSNIYKEYFKNENPVFIFIGRLTKVKKLNYIIEAQEDLRKNNVFVNNIFIGDGEDLSSLMLLAKGYNADNSNWFYGASYSENEISDLVYNADLCLSPGNVGLTAIHSMMYGTPVLTHNDFTKQMPEFEAILRGKTGDFFKKDDLTSMRIVLINWLELHKDRDLIRINCFQRIDEYFNPNYQLEIILKVLNEK